MSKEDKKCECGCDCSKYYHYRHHGGNGGGCGGIYFFGMVATAIYFVHQVSGFWPIVWAIIRAFAWPGYLVYHLLTAWNM